MRFAMKREQPRRSTLRQSQGALAMAMAAAIVAADANAAPRKAVSAEAPSIQTQPVTAQPAPPPPAPMGVFGADMPAAGKLVLSITPIFANLSGIKMGTRTVSNEYIVTTVPFFLNPRQTVRIIPQNMGII